MVVQFTKPASQRISGELTKPTTEIVLNVLEIKLKEAQLEIQVRPLNCRMKEEGINNS